MIYTTVAAAGSANTDATEIAVTYATVTGADGTVGVRLSRAFPGNTIYVYNTHATSGLKVYPHIGGDVNDGSADAAVTIEGKSLGIFVCMDGVTWAASYVVNT